MMERRAKSSVKSTENPTSVTKQPGTEQTTSVQMRDDNRNQDEPKSPTSEYDVLVQSSSVTLHVLLTLCIISSYICN